MSHSRRNFIQGAAALISLSGCDPEKTVEEESLERTPEPERWDPPETVNESTFSYGLQIGDVESDSAIISIHASVSEMEIRVMEAQENTWVEVQILNIETQEGMVQTELTGLKPDTAYCVAAYKTDGSERSRVSRFRTALSEDGNRIIRFGATSCLGGQLPWPTLSRAAEEDFDFFLLLGDTVYADRADTPYEYRQYWNTALSQQGFKDLSASTSLIATWDDHEVGNNWTWEQEGIAEKVSIALQAFRDAIPMRQGSGDNGIWRKFSWGKTVDVFVLDCRGERKDGNYISVEQLEWIKTSLSESRARFKLVMTSVTIVDFFNLTGSIQAEDRWQGYPAQREELLNHIEDQQIDGVLWLTGDFHYGSVSLVGPPGGLGDGMYEVMCGPSGSFLNIMGLYLELTDQFLLAFADWNYVRFTCDPSLGTVHVEFVNGEGEVLDEMVLNV